MLSKDKERIKICIKYKDYYSLLEYAQLIKKNYDKSEQEIFNNLIQCVKTANYEKIEEYFK